jgi:hypothetical protein
MKHLVNLFTEWCEIFRPSLTSSEVGIFRVELETIPVCQAIEHRINHVVQFHGKTAVNAHMIDEPPGEGVVKFLPI